MSVPRQQSNFTVIGAKQNDKFVLITTGLIVRVRTSAKFFSRLYFKGEALEKEEKGVRKGVGNIVGLVTRAKKRTPRVRRFFVLATRVN